MNPKVIEAEDAFWFDEKGFIHWKSSVPNNTPIFDETAGDYNEKLQAELDNTKEN